MNQSEMERRLVSVAGDYAVAIGWDATRYGTQAAAEVPSDYHGDAAKEWRHACEVTARKVDGGASLDAPGRYAIKVFAGRLKTPAKAERSSSTDAFTLETAREIEEADADIRRLPQSRHDRVEAIERWRRERFTSRATPAPLWALYGFDSEETYAESSRRLRERARTSQGLARPMPAGMLPIASVVQHSQTLRDLDATNNPEEDDDACPF